MRRLLYLLVLAGCDDGTTGDVDPIDGAPPDAAVDATPPDAFVDPWCTGPVEQRYDPLNSTEIELFPDDLLTREDPESPTGLHLEVRPEVAPWVNTVPAVLRGAIDDLPTLSGFGTHAGAVMRFTAPVAASEHMFTLYDLGETPPVTVPIELTLREEGATVIIQPLRPLRPATRHALFAAGLTDGDGGCVRPSPALRALLTDDALAPALEGMRARYHAALEATEVDPYTLNAATVFTTHGDLDVVAAAAADVTTRAYAWSAPPVCDDRGDYRRCDGEFEAYDYRDDRHIATAAPGEAWTLPVSVWLPASGPGPFPTLVYGHGLGGSRGEGRALARLYCPRGFAIIAIDAMRHGAHPTADPEDPLPALAFLGIDLQQVRIDALALRGHFNQSNLDRLQLIELVRDSPDVDGDGVADLDIDRLAYWGISLGGMLGSGLLALSDDLGAGILSVAGGGLLLFVTDTSSVANLRPAILRLFGGEDRFERMLPLAQTLVDAADPAAWGPYVTGPRLSGAQHRPDVLLPVAAEDDTVPPASGRALARALGATHSKPVTTPVRLLDVEGAPIANNLEGATSVYFQYDRVSVGGGRVTRAGHGNTPLSREAELQARHFLETWQSDGPAEVIDPYSELETPPLR